MSISRSYNLPDGGLYYGELNEVGLPESISASGLWDDGKRYVGQWKNGQISGVGTLFYPDGKQVYGYWWNGELLHEFKNITNNNLQPPTGSNKITALLIGNNNYSDKPLINCVKDVEALGKELLSIGTDVNILTNATKAKMVAAIKGLEEKSKSFDNVLFYFSGHGASNQGRHYIIAIDEKVSEKMPLSLEEIDEFLSDTDFENIILVSDACSTIIQGNGNPAPVISAGRTLKVFSSSLGSSWDGIPNEHSPFAFGLLQYISQPMSVIQIFHEANKFCMAYAIDHSFYQHPDILMPPFFPMDFYLR